MAHETAAPSWTCALPRTPCGEASSWPSQKQDPPTGCPIPTEARLDATATEVPHASENAVEAMSRVCESFTGYPAEEPCFALLFKNLLSKT